MLMVLPGAKQQQIGKMISKANPKYESKTAVAEGPCSRGKLLKRTLPMKPVGVKVVIRLSFVMKGITYFHHGPILLMPAHIQSPSCTIWHPLIQSGKAKAISMNPVCSMRSDCTMLKSNTRQIAIAIYIGLRLSGVTPAGSVSEENIVYTSAMYAATWKLNVWLALNILAINAQLMATVVSRFHQV